MNIMVLGGDGFCGWPTSLYLAAQGHYVMIVDSLVRRSIDRELGTSSLTPIQPLPMRLRAARKYGWKIDEYDVDLLMGYRQLRDLMLKVKPDVIVHFAEYRAAPYSMKSPLHRRETIGNNVGATSNVLAAMVETGIDAHLVHLGTMGVYGYSGDNRVPEGYVEFEGRTVRHPTDPGSIYHMTKCLDAEMFAFYAKNDGLKITDLHQGIVWGTQTEETWRDQRLINRFDYDGDFGTVLNRFLMQAAIGHPLTVHGAGDQMRAFIHVQDMVRCIELAMRETPEPGRVSIYNQMTEVHRLNDLAEMIASMCGAKITHVDNPRKEDERNSLDVDAQRLPKLGLEPIRLSEGLLTEVMEVASAYADRADTTLIPCESLW